MLKQVVTVQKDKNFRAYELVDIEKYGQEGERFISYEFLLDTMRKLMGRTLTLLDASIVDKTQNKAVKDVVRNIFSDEMEFATDWAWDQKVVDAMIPEDIDPAELGTATIEEALGVE